MKLELGKFEIKDIQFADKTYVKDNILYVNKEDADNKRTDRFAWTADSDCLRWVGYWNSQTGNDRATAAGTIKATELVLSYGGVEYTVDIDDITIINPTPPS